MMERTRLKPFFTRQRLIAGAVGGGVIFFVLAWWTGMVLDRYEGPLAVMFERFERRQTESGWVARVYLTNISITATCQLYYPQTFGLQARFFSSYPHDQEINVRTNP